MLNGTFYEITEEDLLRRDEEDIKWYLCSMYCTVCFRCNCSHNGKTCKQAKAEGGRLYPEVVEWLLKQPSQKTFIVTSLF